MFFLFLTLFACITWYRRDIALAVLLFALPSYLIRYTIGTIPTTLLEGMIVILFSMWFIRDCKGIRGFVRYALDIWKSATKLEKGLYVSLAIFLFFATVSVFVSPSLRGALGIWRAYFIEPALVFIVLRDVIRTKAQFRMMLSALIASGVVIALLAVYQRFTGWHIPTPWLLERRVTSVYGYPNAIGLYLAPLVFVVLGRFGEMIHVAQSAKKKILYCVVGAVLAALFFSAIFFAQTESALLALAGVIVLFGIAWNRRSRIVTLIGVLGVIIFFVVSPPAVSLLKEKVLLNDWSGRVRKVMWQETTSMLSDHNIFGAGLDGFQTVYAPYHKAKYFEIFLYPHNIVLNFWSETGLGGLISFFAILTFYFALLFATLKSALTRAPEDQFLIRLYCFVFASAMLTILIHGLVDAPYFKNDLSVLFWALFVCGVFLYRYATVNSESGSLTNEIKNRILVHEA